MLKTIHIFILCDVQFQHGLALGGSILLFCLANDFHILTFVYRIADVFIPNVSVREFVSNVLGVVLLIAGIGLSVLRKNHARKLSQELFVGTGNNENQHRVYWLAMLVSTLSIIVLILLQSITVSIPYLPIHVCLFA